jgi:hypothetical protein
MYAYQFFGPICSITVKNKDRKFMGRIIVHDRIQVESKILPRYFNHSSFASLRRQLNYFNFVRLGKGRQRESTYINENVVELDDILHLKRRPATSNTGEHEGKLKLHKDFPTEGKKSFQAPPILDLSKSTVPQRKRSTLKRRRVLIQPKVITVSPRSSSPFENNLISEDEHNESFNINMKGTADDEFLTGCRDLLNLASKRWE